MGKQKLCAAWVLAAFLIAGCGSPGGSNITKTTIGGGGAGAGGLFLYTANQGTQNVSGYRVGSGGTLNLIAGSPFASGAGPRGLAATADGQFLFVAHSGPDGILSFQVDAAAGALLRTAQPATIPPSSPAWIARSGDFLYSANSGSGNVSGFSIQSASAALAPVTGSPFPAGAQPSFVTGDAQGRFLFVLNASSTTLGQGTVSAYGFNPVTGQLTPTPNSPFQLPAIPRWAVVDRSGGFLYVAVNGVLGGPPGDFVAAFAIQGTGDLVAVSGSPFALGRPAALAAHPTTSLLFVADATASRVAAFRINFDGTLTEVIGSPFALPAAPLSMAISPAGDLLFVGHAGQVGVSVLAVESATGNLALVAGSPFANPGSGVGNLIAVQRAPQ